MDQLKVQIQLKFQTLCLLEIYLKVCYMPIFTQKKSETVINKMIFFQ